MRYGARLFLSPRRLAEAARPRRASPERAWNENSGGVSSCRPPLAGPGRGIVPSRVTLTACRTAAHRAPTRFCERAMPYAQAAADRYARPPTPRRAASSGSLRPAPPDAAEALGDQSPPGRYLPALHPIRSPAHREGERHLASHREFSRWERAVTDTERRCWPGDEPRLAPPHRLRRPSATDVAAVLHRKDRVIREVLRPFGS